MTFSVGHVQGGTGAGRKIQKTLARWVCGCPDKSHPGTTYSCPDCGTRRP